MQIVYSNDGTAIAFDKYGKGPVIILVDGATETRSSPSKPVLCKLLEPYFTVINYDRRGRGDSLDTLPYSVMREIEDIEAIADFAGGTVYLYGHSSGGALAMEAALTLNSKIKKLAVYEVPYNDDPAILHAWKYYLKQLSLALSEKRNEEAITMFMKFAGVSDDQISSMGSSSYWKAFTASAPTLAYDNLFILGEDLSVPKDKAKSLSIPTLIMSGNAGNKFMGITASALSAAIPNSKLLILEGQNHAVSPEKLAPALIDFFTSF
jgi:pimeloyl-ACP methyl ester carboxylesterase